MDTGTYGLTQASRGPQGADGETLMGVGSTEGRQGLALLGTAAQQDNQRIQANKQVAAQQTAGNAQLGSAAGSIAGSFFGPWGTMIGGALGGIAGSYF